MDLYDISNFIIDLFDKDRYRSSETLLRKGVVLLESSDPDDWFLAVKCLKLSEKRGNIQASYQIALCYLDGKGVPRNRHEALKRLLLATENGNTAAMARLSFLYIDGIPDFEEASHFHSLIKEESATSDVIKDIEKSKYWAEKSVSKGESSGYVVLGYIYSINYSVYYNIDCAIHNYRSAFSAMNPRGALGLAQLLLQFHDDNDDLVKEAEKALTFASESQIPAASYLLGGLYELGKHVPKNTEKSRILYRKAAQAGMPKAMLRLGILLSNGIGGNVNNVEGETWLRRAASKGEFEAIHILANNYLQKDDYNYAMRFLEMGSELDDPVSIFQLAEIKRTIKKLHAHPNEYMELYMKSLNFKNSKSVDRIIEYLNDSSHCKNYKNNIIKELYTIHDNDNELASFAIARYIRLSEKENQEEARNLFLHASEKGLIDAHVSAGEMIVNGIGGKKDAPYALKLFLKAAHAGHVGAMYACGTLFQGTQGIEPDLKQAIEWHKRAAAGGHLKSRHLIERSQSDHGPVQQESHAR